MPMRPAQTRYGEAEDVVATNLFGFRPSRLDRSITAQILPRPEPVDGRPLPVRLPSVRATRGIGPTDDNEQVMDAAVQARPSFKLAVRMRVLLVSQAALTVLLTNRASRTGPFGVREDGIVFSARAGGPLPGISTDEPSFFDAARATFQEIDTVAQGLGPRFNGDSCAMCHAQPAVGGTSPRLIPN
jgi:hypothetical protein